MRKILNRLFGLPAALLAAAIVAACSVLVFLKWRDDQTASFVSSIVAANSPIAELASRRIVWKVVRSDSSVSCGSFRVTVYTIKA